MKGRDFLYFEDFKQLQIKQVVFFWGCLPPCSFFFSPVRFILHPVLIGTLILTNLFHQPILQIPLQETETGTVHKAFILINMYAMVVLSIGNNALIS